MFLYLSCATCTYRFQCATALHCVLAPDNIARFPTNVHGCVVWDEKNRSMELLQRIVFAPPWIIVNPRY